MFGTTITNKTLPFWDGSGKCHQLEGYSESFEHWGMEERSEELAFLLQCVEMVAHSKIKSTALRAQDMNITFEASLDNDTSVIVKQCRLSDRADAVSQAWSIQRFTSETRIMRWLAKTTDLPVPGLLHVSYNELPRYFAVMEKLPGKMLMNTWGKYSPQTKDDFVAAYADISLTLFRTEVPQKIGTTSYDLSSDTLNVIPKIFVQAALTADRVYETLEGYLEHLFVLKRCSPYVGPDEFSRARANGCINRLKEHVRKLCLRLKLPSFRRCVLVHDDLHEANILADDNGRITGLLDWELHSIQPAVLAASYPPWLLDDANADPRFAKPGTWWLQSPQEGERLRLRFDKIVQARDPEYYDMLKQGALLRGAVRWLLELADDHGCERMEAWMRSTFKPDE